MTLAMKNLGFVQIGHSSCPYCGANRESFTNTPESVGETSLFCRDDGAKLFPDEPEKYKIRRRQIREWQKSFPALKSDQCSNCRQPLHFEEPYCGICGRRTYPMHWDEKAYRDQLKLMRRRGEFIRNEAV